MQQTTLNGYLEQKRTAWLARKEAADNDPDFKATALKAHVRALRQSGVREIRIRDFQVISNSPAGFRRLRPRFGPPELQLGVLGTPDAHYADSGCGTWPVDRFDRGRSD
jgi:hypothetical protein